MNLLKLIIWGLIFYLGYKLVKDVFKSLNTNRTQVQGRSRSESLDLKNEDVEDADFKELE